MNPKMEFKIKGERFVLIDVSSDSSWSDVKVVEAHYSTSDTLFGTINWREKTFAQRARELKRGKK